MAPRFRQKVVEPTLGLGMPCWVTDPDFDLHYHVRHVRLTEGADWRELFSVAEQVAMTPFDRARSPWEAELLEGLPDGRAALLLKLHHSMTDGMGGFQLFSQLHSKMRDHDPKKPQPIAPPPEWISPNDLMFEQLSRDVMSAPYAALKGIGTLYDAIRQPAHALDQTRRFVESLSRVVSDPGADGSPLLRERSLSWNFMALDVRFADLRAAGKAADGSLNDAFLASLLGAFRIYHAKLGCSIEKLPMAMPISVRQNGDAAGGNKFAAARFAGPVGVSDPRARIQAIRTLVRAARDEPAVDGMAMITPLLARIPAALLSPLAGSLTRSNDLQASNVPGFREELYIAGARIERVYGFGPLPGCATMITLVTHGDTCCVAVNLDLAAITDPDLFGDCLEQGFIEVLSLAEGAEKPVRRI
jgi:WS/DGAT/MGAT family acyltransferase